MKTLVVALTTVFLIAISVTTFSLLSYKNSYIEPVIEGGGVYKSQKYGFEVLYPVEMYSIELGPDSIILDDTLEYENGVDAEVFIYIHEIPEYISVSGDREELVKYLVYQADTGIKYLNDFSFGDNTYSKLTFSPPDKKQAAYSYLIKLKGNHALSVVAKDASVDESVWFQRLLEDLSID